MENLELRLKNYLNSRNMSYSFEMKVVFNQIIGEKELFSADSLYKKLESGSIRISRATIYRHLAVFENAGLIKNLPSSSGQKKYELVQSANHDGYLLCTSCGKVININDRRLNAAALIFSERHNFQVENINMIVKGLCNICRQKAEK